MRVVFAGTPAFAVPSLEILAGSAHRPIAVYTQPDRPAGRGRALKAGPVKSRALELGIAVRQPQSLRNEEAQRALRDLGPEVIVVVAYGLILPRAVLDTPRLGCINLHPSLLPRWRGAAPIEHALLGGDAETGVSIMQMNAGLDTGDVLLQRRLPIGPRDTAGELQAALSALGARVLLEVVERLGAGPIPGEPQNEQEARYAPKIDKRDAIIDWHEPAERIARQVRAFNPRPIAETRLAGEQLRIWEATPLQAAAHEQPGTVLQASSAGIDVATGEGSLRLLRVQLPGRRPVSAHELRNAHSLPGTALG